MIFGFCLLTALFPGKRHLFLQTPSQEEVIELYQNILKSYPHPGKLLRYSPFSRVKTKRHN